MSEPVIHMVDPKTLVPYEHNALKHSQAQVNKLASLIAAFGFDQPIVVDKDGVIIKGHGRREAAMLLKMAQVPVIISELTPEQARAARLADNKSRTLEYDDDMLRFELGTLKRNSFNMSLTGLDTSELEKHIAALDDAPVKQVSPPVAQRVEPPPPPPPGPVKDVTEEAKAEVAAAAAVEPVAAPSANQGGDEGLEEAEALSEDIASPQVSDGVADGDEEDDDGLDVDGVNEEGEEVLSGGAGGMVSTPFNFLSFGDVKIAIMDNEIEQLSARVEAYRNEFGTLYGFVKYLLKA